MVEGHSPANSYGWEIPRESPAEHHSSALIPRPVSPPPHASIAASKMIDVRGDEQRPYWLLPAAYSGCEFRWYPNGKDVAAVRIFSIDGTSADYIATADDLQALGRFLINQAVKLQNAPDREKFGK